MMKQEILNDLKTIIASKWCAAFFLMLVSFLYDIVLFSKNEMSFSSSVYTVILVAYYCCWLFVLFLGRATTIFVLICNFLIFCVLKEYYKFHTIPLKLDMILNLYKDGIIAGFKNLASLFDVYFWIFFVVLLLQIKSVLSKSFYSIKKALSILGTFLISGSLYYYFVWWGTEAVVQLLYPNLFLSYQQGMLYKIKWPIEFFSPKDNQVNKLILKGNKKFQEQIQNDDIFLSFLPTHIYLIQVESLTTKALDNMPFFNILINQANSKYYIDRNHEHCLGSANTDFMMMSGYTFDCVELHTLVFYAYPTDIYKKTKTLSQVMKEQGYKTTFVHGYKGDFFNRKKHYSKMSFDTVIFEEDFSQSVKHGEWGIGDYSLLKEVSKLKSSEKSFYFIITAGMHPPYDVPEVNENTEPSRTNINSYLNAALFFDKGLKELYLSAPNDSLFVIYGDHNVPDIKAFDTPLLITYKGEGNIKITGIKEKGFWGTLYFVNSLLNERTENEK